MAKRKAKVKRQPRRESKPKGEPWWKRFFRFIWLPPVRRLILAVIIVALLFWYWTTLTAWAAGVRDSTLALFGWGVLFLVMAFGILVGVLWGRRVLSVIYHWNQWLGGVAFILAAWGILAFFQLGGGVGQSIIDRADLIGGLRLLGLVIIGIILVAPGATWRVMARFTSWIGEQLRKRPAPKPVTHVEPTTIEMPAPPPVTVPQEPPPKEPEAEVVTTALTPTPAQQELRQVAQEVWKKYGESPALVMVDGWRLPPIDILDSVPEVEFGQADNMQRAKLIEEALASYGVEAKVVQINAGPTVTQFGVEPGWDRKLREVKERDKDGNVKVRLEEVSKTRVKV
jgi:S-DNA-T family DNA segregation ATPase FtsK/SpoIIIE